MRIQCPKSLLNKESKLNKIETRVQFSNPLEFESLADHQDVTFSFTDLPFEQSTIDSTTDFSTDFTTSFTTGFTTGFTADFATDFTTEFINDEMTLSSILSTDHEIIT